METTKRAEKQAYTYDHLDDANVTEEIPLNHDDHLPVMRTRWGKSPRPATLLSVIKDVGLLVVSLLAIAASYQTLQPPRNSAGPCDCGDSVAEAKQMGCEYDTMAAAWLPQHCLDKGLIAEFDKAGDGPGGRWQYWADANHTYEFTKEEVGQLADTPGKLFYTTPRWHFMHCFFYWRKQQRAKITGVTIERRYDNERHVKHCGHMFDNPGHTAYSYVELKSSSPEPPDFVKDLMVED